MYNHKAKKYQNGEKNLTNILFYIANKIGFRLHPGYLSRPLPNKTLYT